MPIARDSKTSTPSALKRFSTLLRLKLGPELAQAIITQSDDVDSLHDSVDRVSGFKVDQVGNLSVEQLAIRNVTSRYHFEDPVDAQAVAAAGYRIPLVGEWIRLNNTSGGALTLTSVPTIAVGLNGQIIELLNVSAQNIVLQDNGTLAGSTLRLGAATRTLGQRDSIALRYSTDLAAWVERFFSNVL